MTSFALPRWLAFGSGVGVEITGANLEITAVRIRPSGARVLATLTIENFESQPAGVWGTEYAAFLKKHGLKHLAATILLPRQEVIVRHLSLPGIADRDLSAAVAYQMETLHPYAEEDVAASWARLPGTPHVLVGIARRPDLERYMQLFAEAGVKTGAISISAAAVYAALRIFGKPPASGFLAFTGGQLYGESEARPVFSAAAADPSRALAELRLNPETPLQPLSDLLPLSASGERPRSPLSYAAALASANSLFSLPLNLLPVEHRAATSRARLIPTAALGVLVLLGAGALAGYSAIENRRYRNALETEIAKYEPASRRMTQLDREIEQTRARAMLLDRVRLRTRRDLDSIAELTRLFNPPTWVNGLELNRTTVIVSGETDQAAPLVKLIDGSPMFAGSEFAMPPMRIDRGELFRIRAAREGAVE